MTEAQQHVAQNVIQAAALSGNAKSEPHRFTEGARARDVHRVEHIRDEDDELLQFAIQQSLLENGSENDQVTVWEALTNRRPSDTSPNQPNRTVTPSAYISYEERQLQRAIEGRLHDTAAAAAAAPAAMSVRSSDSDLVNISNGNMSENSEPECSDDQLRIAMAMSQREADGAAARRKQEQAELERIIQLSFTEK
ncbi:PREDICTED: ankyrin repeat domain-containing protein 13D-like [Priapulus caudatus]|uniref:Ankyrin repeat domain-containing protein 13D-like n=1 Tax=Priapulus caudatus TaxID=37621 RepID=A0ABM1DYA1_PRICU|nr:PREDICTED: ankyrin repeat domain-containing protein 13D-like [Priapulus caudatus]